VKIQRESDHYRVYLAKGEKALLWDLLNLYPCVQGVSTAGRAQGGSPENTDLLEEALSEQRAEAKKQLKKFLADEGRFESSEEGWRFLLSNSEMEWLLQILNDVRVGSWIQLGAPEEKLQLARLDENTAPHFWAMEMAGHFEMQILLALSK